MKILVTGGAGYIGSHAAARLVRDGHSVVIVDNLFRGHAGAVEAVGRAAGGVKPTFCGAGAIGQPCDGRLLFYRADITDRFELTRVMVKHRIEAVMHFAALAYVGESVSMPAEYWRVNAGGVVALLQAAETAGVSRLVFSSTTATYGDPAPSEVPIKETLVQRPVNPYGASKLACERAIRDFAGAMSAAGRPFAAALLRYFNVAGCDGTGELGEHHEPETHLIPIVLQCLQGVRPELSNTVTVFGSDYPTPDGTCVRDYVHVDDLVDAHVKVLGSLMDGEVRAYNVGTGTGLSVRQVIDAAEKVTGKKVSVKTGPRRAGDPATLYADASLIKKELGWTAKHTDVTSMIESAWAWMSKHPRGYGA
jgi:UDP-glucose 4-epimerase